MVTFYISQIIEGMATGSIYGLMGLSIMFVYRSNRVLNFSQGEMATAVAFVGSIFFERAHPLLGIMTAFVFGFVLGFVVEAGILKLVSTRDELSVISVTIGVYAIINSVNSWIFGYEPYSFPSPFPDGGIIFGAVFVSYQSLGVLGITFATSTLLFLMFRYTALGIALRGISEDSTAAELKGIRVWLLVSVAWGIAGVLGGLAGMLAVHANFLYPSTMTAVLIYSMEATVIGGLQTSFGAMVGGILVGILENLAGTVSWIGSDLKTTAVFVTMLIFLLIKPFGLFGRDEPRKI